MNIERTRSERRIVALEIRPRVIGFVVFDERTRLVDWGSRKYRVRTQTLSKVLTKKLNVLLDLYVPSAVVVRTREVRSRTARRRIDIVTGILRAEAKRRAIKVQILSTKAIRRRFAFHHCTTKQEIAGLIAGWFRELSLKLPPKRKHWRTEDSRMILFDAAATALTFLEVSPTKTKSTAD
jgi:hypothetical protein